MEIDNVNTGPPNLGVSYLFEKSWQVFKDNLRLVIGVAIVFGLLSNIGTSTIYEESDTRFSVQLANLLIGGPLTAGTFYLAVKLIRGETAKFAEMFYGFKVFLKAFLAFLLYSVLVAVGFIMLIIPGIILAVGLSPTMYLVMDADLGATDTLRRAWEMTRGHRGSIFILALVIIALNVAGVLFFLIGIIFTGAFSLLVGAAAYNELAQATGNLGE